MKNKKNIEMKNYKTYTMIRMVLVLLIVLSACDKDFLKEDLRSGLSPSGFFNNHNEAQMAVNGVYALLNNKNLYRNLITQSFEKKINIKKKYDSVSMIGCMTYCKKPIKVFSLVFDYLKKNGIFIFTHRIDLWNKQNFDLIINNFNKSYQLVYKSRPLSYLPKNSSFSDKIKIRIVILKKI